MNNIEITGASDTPTVFLSKTDNKFEFSGKSMPEDVAQFYGPILEWIDEYAQSPNAKTVVDFKMVYFNTASSKMILDVMMKFEEMYQDGKDVLIRWFYPEDDEDMQEAGEEYADMVDLPFEQVAS